MRWLLALISILFCLGTLSGDVLANDPLPKPSNGHFEAPAIQSYHQLSPSEHRRFQEAAKKIFDPSYKVVRIAVTNVPRYIGPSYYVTPEGAAELRELSTRLIAAAKDFGSIVFVGRSGAGIKAYLAGVFDRAGQREPALRELPFSCNEPGALSAKQKSALREHLAANELSPRQILAARKPIMLMDFVYTGTGVGALLKAIYEWAHEQGISLEQLKAKLGFFGAYPARMLVVNNLMRINHDSLREGYPIHLTEELIQNEMRGRRMPNWWFMQDHTSTVHAFKISDTFYDYAGNLVNHPNPSFRPEHWAEPLERSAQLSFAGNSADTRYVELYHLMSAGRRDSAELLRLASCERPLVMR